MQYFLQLSAHLCPIEKTYSTIKMKKIPKIISIVLVGVLCISNSIQLYYLQNTSKKNILLEQRISDAIIKISKAEDQVHVMERRIGNVETFRENVINNSSSNYSDLKYKINTLNNDVSDLKLKVIDTDGDVADLKNK